MSDDINIDIRILEYEEPHEMAGVYFHAGDLRTFMAACAQDAELNDNEEEAAFFMWMDEIILRCILDREMEE